MEHPTKNRDKVARPRSSSTRTKRADVDVTERDIDKGRVHTKTRLQRSKEDQHGMTAQGRQKLVADASSDDDSVEVGATRVRGLFSGHTADVEEPTFHRSPPLADYTVEAIVVEDSSPGLREEEQQEFERQTRERLLREIESAAVHADVLVEKERSCSRFACIFTAALVTIATITASVLVFGPSSKEGGSSAKSVLTSSPNPTQQPSLVPTLAPRNNTYCEEAHELSIGLEVYGTFDGAIDATVIACFPMFIYESPGLWYLYSDSESRSILRGYSLTRFPKIEKE